MAPKLGTQLGRGRLQNYPTHEFQTEDEWSAFFSRDMAPTRVRLPSGQPVSWALRVASVQDLRVAYGVHASDIEIDQIGSGEGLHIHVPLSGQAALTVGDTTVMTSREQAILFDFGRPHRLQMWRATGYEALALNIPTYMLDEEFMAISGYAPCGPIEFEPTLNLVSAPGRTLVSVTNALATGLENGLLLDAPIAIKSLSQALLRLLIQAGPHQFFESLQRSPSPAAPRHVKRAIDFMHANIAEPLTSAQIAEDAGVSVRALEVGFRTFKDTTPMAYLRSIRLDAARDELAMPDNSSSIAEIAYRWGFTHLGRFSAVYREAYGELPSETAARCRG
ncbi:AraC family transcriptional regulator [Pelagibacterium halotolerans]|uniref:helix-turn-helix transcriptional regulator n=1 Tax=Pelagibacterium halotolerans TaxID=531813 RepID=UPI0038500869